MKLARRLPLPSLFPSPSHFFLCFSPFPAFSPSFLPTHAPDFTLLKQSRRMYARLFSIIKSRAYAIIIGLPPSLLLQACFCSPLDLPLLLDLLLLDSLLLFFFLLQLLLLFDEKSYPKSVQKKEGESRESFSLIGDRFLDIAVVP